MLNQVTIVMSYYDNGDMLDTHIAHWEEYGAALRAAVQVIIVDDASPNKPAVMRLRGANVGFPIRVFRIRTDIPWNQDGARNLGMYMCDTEWAFMTDMDHVLPAEQAAAMFNMQVQYGTYYMPGQLLTDGQSLNRPHPNSYLFARSDFWRMGGYDEDFAGYYGSDGNFRRCAQGAGLKETFTRAFNTVVYRTHDVFDANTKGLGRKDSPYHVKRNKALVAKAKGPVYRASRPMRFEYDRVL